MFGLGLNIVIFFMSFSHFVQTFTPLIHLKRSISSDLYQAILSNVFIMNHLSRQVLKRVQYQFVSKLVIPRNMCVGKVGENIPTEVQGSITTPTVINLQGLSEEQLKLIEERDTSLRTRHAQIEAVMSPEDQDLVRRKRIIYRSKQRGLLEVDILLGSWAVDNVPKLTVAELDEYEGLLNLETQDIFNLISKMPSEIPAFLKDSVILKRVQVYAAAITSDLSTPDSYAVSKRRTNLT